ncbi:MAG: TIGR03960 family B12-binding radical SAM protein [Thermodesulfobacteriota bacterium]
MGGDELKEVLSLVSKPVRYLGQEFNAIRKDPAQIRLNFCLAFPDVYEVGMSHLGIQILYHVLNGKEGVACERVFAPWVDMERVMRDRGLPLSSLESSTPLNHFDILGFSLQYELGFTNVLNMLDLSGIPFFSEERDERFPLVIAGGPAAFNPEPVADFFDAIVIGDGEEVVLELCDQVMAWKEARGKKEELLTALSKIEGVYIPSLHTKGQKIRKRFISDLNLSPIPTCPIVPYMKVVHDRLNLEIARGCKRGCRFCEAGFIYRPYRERSPEYVQEGIRLALKQTGYEEVSLLSLSAGDYASIGLLLSHLMDRYASKKVAVSFPSLRIERVVKDLAAEVKRVRKTGFTIAPEAGTERLRRVINKEMEETILFEGLADLFSKGWKSIKLYFMMGLPSEREEDLRGILRLAREISCLGEKQKIHPNIHVSVSTFVPKPHTPFQWESQIPLEMMKENLSFLRSELKKGTLRFKWQDPHLSFLEGIFSVGNRPLSRVLIEAHRLGCRFDGWSDQFHYSRWEEAFAKAGVKMDAGTRRKAFNEVFPWSFIDMGIEPAFLWEEYQRGLREETSPPCREDCSRCGVCNGASIRVRESHSQRLPRTEKEGDRRIRRRPMRQKVRLRFSKRGEIRFISHLELAHLFHRASKRAALPLAYSEGFHPMPRIIFATAIPVGMESQMEVVDMELESRLSPNEVRERLNQVLPQGVQILEAEEIPLSTSAPMPFTPSVYWMPLDRLIPREEARIRIQKALENEELILHQERKGKRRSVDVRPLIQTMEVKEGRDDSEEAFSWGIELVLRNGMGRTAKPTEIIGAILGLKEEILAQCKIVKLE